MLPFTDPYRHRRRRRPHSLLFAKKMISLQLICRPLDFTDSPRSTRMKNKGLPDCI